MEVRLGLGGGHVIDMRLTKDMRVVCVCWGGQVRSVAARHILADHFGFRKVLACGWEKNDGETLGMLCAWADVVLLVGSIEEWLVTSPIDKTIKLAVGPDVWGHYGHPDLLQKVMGLIRPLIQLPLGGR